VIHLILGGPLEGFLCLWFLSWGVAVLCGVVAMASIVAGRVLARRIRAEVVSITIGTYAWAVAVVILVSVSEALGRKAHSAAQTSVDYFSFPDLTLLAAPFFWACFWFPVCWAGAAIWARRSARKGGCPDGSRTHDGWSVDNGAA
jgi:hypothetical protein